MNQKPTGVHQAASARNHKCLSRIEPPKKGAAIRVFLTKPNMTEIDLITLNSISLSPPSFFSSNTQRASVRDLKFWLLYYCPDFQISLNGSMLLNGMGNLHNVGSNIEIYPESMDRCWLVLLNIGHSWIRWFVCIRTNWCWRLRALWHKENTQKNASTMVQTAYTEECTHYGTNSIHRRMGALWYKQHTQKNGRTMVQTAYTEEWAHYGTSSIHRRMGALWYKQHTQKNGRTMVQTAYTEEWAHYGTNSIHRRMSALWSKQDTPSWSLWFPPNNTKNLTVQLVSAQTVEGSFSMLLFQNIILLEQVRLRTEVLRIPMFDPTGVQTHDFQIMTVHFMSLRRHHTWHWMIVLTSGVINQNTQNSHSNQNSLSNRL